MPTSCCTLFKMLKKLDRTFKIILCLTIFLLSIIIILLIHILTEVDLSTKAVYGRSSANSDPSVYLVSYADGPEIFFKNRNILTYSAINRGVDFIYNYRRFHIDPEFVKNNPILKESLGAGYWLWKPYFILKTLESVPENSIIIYADSGVLFRKPIREFLEQCFMDPNKDTVLFTYDPKDYGLAGSIASGRVFDILKCREDRCRYGHHVWAGLLILKNTEQSKNFIRNWLNYCRDMELLTGATHSNNYPEFKHIQHDESILSVLAARDHFAVNFINMDKNFFQYFHNHRRKTEDQEQSLLVFTSVNLKEERKFLNKPIIKQLRCFVKKIFSNFEYAN